MTVSGYPLSQAHRLMAFAVRQLGGQSVGFCQILYRLELADQKGDQTANLMWGWCSESELAQVRHHREARRPQVYDRRLASGDRCFCLTENGTVVCSNWVAFDRASALVGQDPEIRFRNLDPKECFSYDFYTPSERRGKGFGSMTKRALVGALAQEGFSYLYGLVDPRNAPSTQVHLRLGYEAIEEIYLYRFAGKCYAFQRPVGESVRQWLDQAETVGRAGE